MATIYEVSELAGVSLATVSRVMNKNARVSEKTRDKVLAAMKELGYRPNTIARSLASNRSDSVGILVSELRGLFYSQMMSGIEEVLRASEKHVIIAAGHSEEAEEIDGIEFLIGRRCDALILHVESVSDEYLIDLAKGSIPVVLINRHIPEIADRCISLDNELGGYMSAKALLEKGHRKIAYISGPLWKHDASERFKGHKRALKEYGATYSERLFFEGDYSEKAGVNGLSHLLKQGEDFTGLVCANDYMASGAMTMAREEKLQLPEQLSIVGFDNIIFAAHLYPKLSTINYPLGRMARATAHWVLKNVYKQKNLAEIQNLFEPEFIARDSIATIKE
ncbi:MAG: LacI family DNA-binding transcriptional regulator [Kangiellaceae bacterium]|jgi:LacI family transcriptional regulator, galactose operon repressor